MALTFGAPVIEPIGKEAAIISQLVTPSRSSASTVLINWLTFLKAKNFISANIGLEKIILIKGKKDFQMLKNNLEKNFKVKTKKISQDVFQLIFT